MVHEITINEPVNITIKDSKFVHGNTFALMLENDNSKLTIELSQDNLNELLRAVDQLDKERLTDRKIYDYDNPEFYIDEVIEEDGKRYFKTKEDKKLID